MNTETAIGKLNVLERLKSSFVGNPRYLIEINGTAYRTEPNSSLGYSVTNYDGDQVRAQVRIYRGKWAIQSVKTI